MKYLKLLPNKGKIEFDRSKPDVETKINSSLINNLGWFKIHIHIWIFLIIKINIIVKL